jgi:O-antigen/teichoic acid export membrane protein
MSRSARQVLTLFTGNSLAQLISLAAAPLLARLYTPQDFGVLALYLSAVALLSIVATGRYELAIVLSETQADARHLLAAALGLSLVFSVALLLAVWLWGHALAARLGQVPWVAWMLPLSVALTALINSLSCWANRQQQYSPLAVNRVVQSGASAGASVGLAGLMQPTGLMVGNTLAQGLAATLLLVQTRAGLIKPQRVERARLKALLKRHINFPKVNLPHAVLDALQTSALLALLGAAYGSHALGGYAFALRMARTPLALLGASVGQVFQQRAAQLWNEGADLAPLARRTTQRLAVISLPFIALMCAAPALFTWGFGPVWHEAGVYALILTPWMVLSFLTSPLSQLPLVVGQQGRALAFGVAYQVAMLLPYALAWGLKWPIAWALGLQSAASSIVLVAYGVWLHRLSNMRKPL